MAAQIVRRIVSSDWFDRFARFGYAAKGAIWTIVGILAVRVALGAYEEEADFEGALEALGAQPLNVLLLVLLAIGLLAYAGWRVVQAVVDIEGEGRDATGYLKRALYLMVGLTYGVLAVSALRVLIGWGRDNGAVQDWTAAVLAQPLGAWLVGLAGVLIIVSGIGELYFACSGRYKDEIGTDELGRFQYVFLLCTGWLGHMARGVVYSAVGFFAIRAAVTFDPEEARGLADTFRELAEQPYGLWLVGFIAVGFMSYGLYCLLLALHRHIPNEGLIRGRGHQIQGDGSPDAG